MWVKLLCKFFGHRLEREFRSFDGEQTVAFCARCNKVVVRDVQQSSDK